MITTSNFNSRFLCVHRLFQPTELSLVSEVIMPKEPELIECDKPSYKVLKWIGGGGFGQVFKVLRNGQVRNQLFTM